MVLFLDLQEFTIFILLIFSKYLSFIYSVTSKLVWLLLYLWCSGWVPNLRAVGRSWSTGHLVPAHTERITLKDIVNFK